MGIETVEISEVDKKHALEIFQSIANAKNLLAEQVMQATMLKEEIDNTKGVILNLQKNQRQLLRIVSKRIDLDERTETLRLSLINGEPVFTREKADIPNGKG